MEEVFMTNEERDIQRKLSVLQRWFRRLASSRDLQNAYWH